MMKIFKNLKQALFGSNPKPTPAKKTASSIAPKSAPSVNTLAKNEPFVYVTLKGKKFHYDLLCPGIRNSKEIKMGLSKARKAGYTACDKCCYSYLHNL